MLPFLSCGKILDGEKKKTQKKATRFISKMEMSSEVPSKRLIGPITEGPVLDEFNGDATATTSNFSPLSISGSIMGRGKRAAVLFWL